MTPSCTLYPEILLAVGRVKAVLEVIPRIEGPKDIWMPWLRDGLEAELRRLPSPSPSSPHPRLLGSLDEVLFRHSQLFGLEALDFEEVSENDPSITGPEYVDVPAQLIPAPNLSDSWWLSPPPLVVLRVNTAYPSSGTRKNTSDTKEPGTKSKATASNAGSQPSELRNDGIASVRGTSGIRSRSSAGKRTAEYQDLPSKRVRKKKKFKLKEFVGSDEDEKIPGVFPLAATTTAGNTKVQDPQGMQEVLDSCDTSRSPLKGNESACQTVMGDLKECIFNLSVQVAEMEERQAEQEEAEKEIATRTYNLEVQFGRLDARAVRK
ncbi:hypothetical protein JVU11DRAFT_10872 [Chiua virens]|nr:hypothetical protein JVU11DRAFT_10872 [Chiua virens]